MDLFPSLGQFVARNRSAAQAAGLEQSNQQVQQLLGYQGIADQTGPGGLTAGGIQGQGLMADPTSFARQAEFSTGLMGIPGYQGAGQQYMGQAMANQIGLPTQMLKMLQTQNNSDRTYQEQVRKNNMGPATQQLIAFANDPNTPPEQAQMAADYLRKVESTTINMPGAGERSAAGWAAQVEQTNNLMTEFTGGPNQQGEITAPYIPDLTDEWAFNLPFGIGNHVVSEKYQQYRNGADAWGDANLRPESGALIGKDEAARNFRIYWPQSGDSPETLEQKRVLRAQKTQARLDEAGRAEVKVIDAGKPPASQQPPATRQPPPSAKPVSTQQQQSGPSWLRGPSPDEIQMIEADRRSTQRQ
jgi:hypothetical protein